MPHTDVRVGCRSQHVRRSHRDLGGSELGHLGPSPSSGFLHHLKQVSAPFWTFVSLVDCVTPWISVLIVFIFVSPAFSTVSTPKKIANELCVV